ncbi:tyrosine-protein phosphatase [Orenia marismortui]|uniref:Tyrosine phosphatase family protein n=1 Tax=Orenia marismortui TaxID=46469 RepID=A0A4R8HA64_9FIRM|nr:tyrosine-protein phosphatase [Orenia marismortui]TDX53183.1 tyrosine phosphatase family protein [Orenia marismortui]
MKIIHQITYKDKLKGYVVNNDKVFFIFEKRVYQKKLRGIAVNKVSVKGSFTAWRSTLELKKVSNSLWFLKKDIHKVDIPGSSGQAEFRFIINGSHSLEAPESLSLEHKFYDNYINGYNHIIHLDNSKFTKIKKLNSKIAEYKLEYKSDEELTNFRAINSGDIGENILYRSYHPFKASRLDHPLENKRLKLVQELIEVKQINSIINLSDSEENIPTDLNYYKKIVDNGHAIYTNKAYNYDMFYYITDSDDFANLLKRVVEFILDDNNFPPFLIHCRIGTDRTGIISAILASLMGAAWEEIVTDYQESNKLGIGEYRDESLIAYAFVQMLGADFKENLTQLTDSYFKNRLKLTNDQIQKLKDKLSAKS